MEKKSEVFKRSLLGWLHAEPTELPKHLSSQKKPGFFNVCFVSSRIKISTVSNSVARLQILKCVYLCYKMVFQLKRVRVKGSNEFSNW